MNTEIVNTLNKLIEISKDGEEGFRTAAENVADQELKSTLLERAEGCKKAVVELQNHVASSNEKPERSGDILGAVHRGWINIKSMLTTNGEHAILVECERGEEVAKNAYADALKLDLPDDIRSMIKTQYEGALKNYNLVCQLKNKYAVAN
jgi:uncharacterized protein (TIGR02284 family)